MKRTIRESIITNELRSTRLRLGQLRSLHAPKPAIMVLKEKLQHLENGELTVNDKHQLLDKTYTSVEVKRGRGGQLYVQFTTSEGLINYFPNGKYGPFIARNTD